MSDWPLVLGFFCFSYPFSLKETEFERKIKENNPLSKYLFLKNFFLHAMAVLGYLPKLRRGLRLAFGT